MGKGKKGRREGDRERQTPTDVSTPAFEYLSPMPAGMCTSL